MKKKILIFTSVMALSFLTANTALAGQWQQDTTGWSYQNDDGTYRNTGWSWVDGKCYYFTPEGYCLQNTQTPDGYTVDESGAWTADGVVQVQNQAPVRGWNQVNGRWKYYFSKDFVTSKWKTIDGKRYYFDYDGYMVTGFQHIEGDNYYFNEDGSLRTTSFTMDDTRYVVNSDGVITDELDEFDWYSNNNSSYYDSGNYDRSDNSYDDNNDNYRNWQSSSGTVDTGSYAYEVYRIVNEEREADNKDTLEWDEDLAACAQERAYEIQEKFSHTRPDDTKCYTILDENGISYSSAGENIAYGQSSPESVMNSWMHSSGHKKNILKSSFGRIGVGCAYINGSCYWVQLFTD